jgi:transposase-like protein
MAQKRRKFTAQFKFETVMEVLRGEKSVAQSCRERNITEALYYKWRDAFFERAPSVFEDQRSTSTEPSTDRVAELERMVGQLAMENAILKKASSRLDTARRKNGT